MELLLLLAQLHIHSEDSLPDWYDYHCCNVRDCKPVNDEDISFEILEGIVIVRYKPTNNIFYKNQFRKSQDDRYHVCINKLNNNSICFYDRTGA